MIKFTDAQMVGSQDRKMEGQFNYLIELLSTYLTRGLISSVSGKTYFDLEKSEFKQTAIIDGETIEITINPTVGLQITRDGVLVGGITTNGYFATSRIISTEENPSMYLDVGDNPYPGASSKALSMYSYGNDDAWHRSLSIYSYNEVGLKGVTFTSEDGHSYLELGSNEGSVSLFAWDGNSLGPTMLLQVFPESLYLIYSEATILYIDNTGKLKPYGGLDLSNISDTTSPATHYYVETTGGNVLPKTLANASKEIVDNYRSRFAMEVENDFYPSNIGGVPKNLTWASTASGRYVNWALTANHPGAGVIATAAVPTANSGGVIWTSDQFGYMEPNEELTIIFNIQETQAGDAKYYYIGRHTATSADTTAPTVGIFFRVYQGVLSGYHNTTATGTTYTVTKNVWYKGKISINAARNAVTFTLFSAAGAQLWTSTISASLSTTQQLPIFIGKCWDITPEVRDLLLMDYFRYNITQPLTR